MLEDAGEDRLQIKGSGIFAHLRYSLEKWFYHPTMLLGVVTCGRRQTRNSSAMTADKNASLLWQTQKARTLQNLGAGIPAHLRRPLQLPLAGFRCRDCTLQYFDQLKIGGSSFS